MNDFHKIGSFIKLKMMEQNKSIQSLAEESGYSTKDIGKILDGRLFLSPKQIEEIAGILDLDISEMINCIDVDSTNIIIGVIIAVMKETEDYFGQACCLR
jgi:transcriptional regulator with XRE-family HTH domain